MTRASSQAGSPKSTAADAPEPVRAPADDLAIAPQPMTPRPAPAPLPPAPPIADVAPPKALPVRALAFDASLPPKRAPIKPRGGSYLLYGVIGLGILGLFALIIVVVTAFEAASQ